MTVGIVLTNAVEGIAISDRRGQSYLRRESDRVDTKMGVFDHDNYHGVIIGSGPLDIVASVTTDNVVAPHGTLDEYVGYVFGKCNERLAAFGRQVAQDSRNHLEDQLLLYDDEAKRQKERENGVEIIRQGIVEYQQDIESKPKFILTGYDKLSGRLRTFKFSMGLFDESYDTYENIGAGEDGSDRYLTQMLEGLQVGELLTNHLVFIAINAYSASTNIIGVGGTPQIAHIHKKGYRVLDTTRSTVIANLSGAFMSHYPPSDPLMYDEVLEFVRKILKFQSPPYQKMASRIEIRVPSLKDEFHSLSQWQQRTNRSIFPSNGEISFEAT
jgi:hypothetical protein